MQGTIISHTSNDKKSRTGWAVMFEYECECGLTHSTGAHGVWPTGDIHTDVVQVNCPDGTGIVTDVELTRPSRF